MRSATRPRSGRRARRNSRCESVREVTHADAVVALDLGGTHVSGATVDVGSATVLASTRVRVELADGADRSKLLAGIAHAATAARSREVQAAGVAVPGPF